MRHPLVALLLGSLTAACAEPPAWPGCDVVLVSVDTLRADGLSAYGNPRDTSPELDALAARGLLFEACLSHAPNTAPSHASLFTGHPPPTHLVANLTSAAEGTPALHPDFETLAERFAAVGYETAAFTDGGPLGPAFHLMQGFEHLRAENEGIVRKVRDALEFLDARDDSRPLFLFLHTYQVHQPYAPPQRFVERFDPDYDGPLVEAVEEVRALRRAGEPQSTATRMLRDAASFTDRDREHLRALYDAEVACTDEALARLWERLAARDRPTLIVVTSDHGEEFGEHGHYGHKQLHRETLHVPLIVVPPAGGDGARVPWPVDSIDVHAAVLAAAGLAPQPLSAGRDLLAAVEAGELAPRPSFASTNEHRYASGHGRPWLRSVRADGAALLTEVDGDATRRALYDVGTDPGEREPLWTGASVSGAAAELGLALEADLERHLRDAAARRVLVLGAPVGAYLVRSSRAVEEELRRLGYLDAEPEAPPATADGTPGPGAEDP